MADLFEYMAWRGDLTLNEAKFNEVDGLLLCAFSYIDPIPELLGQEPISIRAMVTEMEKRPMQERKAHMRKAEDAKLLDAMKESERFGSLKILDFKSNTNTEDDTQFAAYLLSAGKNLNIVVFRGTDHTIVGWKEDLNLCYMEAVPSQISALSFLKDSMAKHPGKYIVCGHSKGGNIAVYSATCCTDEEFENVKGVYNYDGPGFPKAFMERDSYTKRLKKLYTFIPESSVIGCLFDHKEPYIVISSTKIGGLAQHDPYTWNLMANKLTPADRKSSSYILDQTFNELLASVTEEQRMKFTQSLFGLFEETGCYTFDELAKPQNLTGVAKAINQMDDETKELFQNVFSIFRKSFTGSFKDTFDALREEKSGQKAIAKDAKKRSSK